MKLHTASWTLLLFSVVSAGRSDGAVNVFLDFNAQWETNLHQATNNAGVPAFVADEVAAIEALITQQFAWQLDDFLVHLTHVDPGGIRERVNFGAVTASTTLLGLNQVNFQNTATSTASVFVANFGFILSPTDDRQTQIDNIGIAISGTGLHELGHSFGMRHHHAYGNPQITPDRYANTLDIQNQHLMATGSTGLTTEQRKLPRTFSRWSNVIMEAAINLTPHPLPLAFEVTDAGSSPSTAQVLPLTVLPISGTQAGFVFATLNSESDVDWFGFDVVEPSLLTAEVWCQGLFAFVDDFDSMLRLFGPDGAMVAENDNVRYTGNLFDAGPSQETDSFLLNIPLVTPGRYFLEVSSVGTVSDPDAGGIYQLIFAIGPAVPEPTASYLAILGWVLSGHARKLRTKPRP